MADILLQMISSESSLVQSVAEVVQSISGLQFKSVPTYANAGRSLRDPIPAVIIAHLQEPADAQRIASLIQETTTLAKRVVTLVIVDGNQPEQTLAMLRHGVAECLERPLNLRRLAYLLDVHTLRLRHGAGHAQPESRRAQH
ncbi:MAG: hypothetical protein QM780_00030 [Hyphomicrobium sp.]|uniref:hypothetical protein n=1 Tax=Hyphomicrobium sp. TaxID=82 RepID=UPI0039E30FCD